MAVYQINYVFLFLSDCKKNNEFWQVKKKDWRFFFDVSFCDITLRVVKHPSSEMAKTK